MPVFTESNKTELNIVLDGFREVGDPLADQVIAQLKADNDDQVGKTLFALMSSNDVQLPDSAPDYLESYFEESRQLPQWADPHKILQAEEMFLRYGPEISLLLMCKSLPFCYSCAKGSKVVALTERFTNNDGNFDRFTKRLIETAQFVMNALSPGSFTPGHNGLVTTQKVRLIHAAIRYYAQKDADWDSSYFGLPINQEDLLGTLMSFSYCIIEGLEQMGIDLTKEQKEAYLHHWMITAHLLGIKHDLLPQSVDEAKFLSYFLLERQQMPSAHGKELNDACIAFMEKMIPGEAFDDIPEIMMRHFLDDKTCRVLAIPHVNEGGIQAKMFSLFMFFSDIRDELGDHAGLMRVVFRKINKVFLQSLLSYFNEGKKVHFYIPPSLRENWGV